jgi:hypothetical protein
MASKKASKQATKPAAEVPEETQEVDIDGEQTDEIESASASAGADSDADELVEHDSDADVDDKLSTEVAETEVARGTAPPNTAVSAQPETKLAASTKAAVVVQAVAPTVAAAEPKAVSAKKPSKPKAAAVVAPVTALAKKPKKVDDEGIEIDESDVITPTEREKKLVEDAMAHTTVSMTYADVVEYTFASKATFTLVMMALMMQEYSKKCMKDYNHRLLQRAIESEDAAKNTQLGDVSNPDERPVRIQQLVDEAAAADPERKLLPIAAGAGKNQLLSPTTPQQRASAQSAVTKELKKEALKKAAEKKAAEKKAGKKVVAVAAAAADDVEGKLPFWQYYISDEELLRDGEGEPLEGASTKKRPTKAEMDELRATARANGTCKKPMPSKAELDTRRAKEIENRKNAGAKNADLLAARHKLGAERRLRNDHDVLRIAIRRSLVRVDVASVSPYLPLREKSNDTDYAAIAELYLMPMLGGAPGGDVRFIMSQCTTVWRGFFLPNLIEAMVRLKETMILVQGRPLTDLLAVGHHIEDRCTKTGSKTPEIKAKFQAAKDKLAALQMFMVKCMDEPAELAKHVKLFFGREPPLDWCRFRLSPLFVDANGQPQHPEPPPSRQKRKAAGSVEAADGDNDDDDEAGDDGDADADAAPAAAAAAAAGDEAKPKAKRQRKKPAPNVAGVDTGTAAVAATPVATVAKRAAPKAKPATSTKEAAVEAAEEVVKKEMQLDAPEESPSSSSDAPAKLTSEEQFKQQAELGAASASKTPMHARFMEGLLFSDPEHAPDERFDTLVEKEGVEPLLAHMAVTIRFRTLAETAAANAVPAHESRTTSLSAGAAAKKRNARRDGGDAANQDDDSGDDEDAQIAIDALEELANGKGVTDEDARADDSTTDADGRHVEITIRANDARFTDIIASQCGIRKKRIEHLFVKLKYPAIAASIERDWRIKYDGESAVVPLQLDEDETARVGTKLLELRKLARAGHAKKHQAIEAEAKAKATYHALTASGEVLPPPPTPYTDAELRKLKKAVAAAANNGDGSTATRAILTMQSSRDPRPERAFLATVPGAAGSGSKVSMQSSTVMMEMLHATAAVDMKKVMTYGQLYELQKLVAAGTTTSEERLALMHTLSHFDVYMTKMMWIRFKHGLIPSNVNPNNFMLVGRLISQRGTGFTLWLGKCLVMKRELARTVASMCYKPDGKFLLPPAPVLDADFTPFVNWAPGAPTVFSPAIESRREFYREMADKMRKSAIAAIKDPRKAAEAAIALQDAEVTR